MRTMRQRIQRLAAKHGDEMKAERKAGRTQADCLRWAGIGPEIVESVTEFIERPESFCTMPLKKRREIENQMDAVLWGLSAQP